MASLSIYISSCSAIAVQRQDSIQIKSCSPRTLRKSPAMDSFTREYFDCFINFLIGQQKFICIVIGDEVVLEWRELHEYSVKKAMNDR